MGTHGCFHFADEYRTNEFEKAQRHCNSLYSNAYLAEIKDEETQIVITALAGAQQYDDWWLGASDFYQVLKNILIY